MSKLVPITQVMLGAEEERLVLEVLRSGHLAQGSMTARLEDEFAAVCGVRHAVAVNSGTTALVGALTALGIGPGDEVVTTPLTFVATLNAILEVGATARFADVDEATFTLDPAEVRTRIGARTRAVMPVHLYGQPADMDAITAAARDVGVDVIEDAAQAHGARVGERAVGGFGVGCFSFYATKNVTTGEGGMVTTDDDGVADRLRVLRNQGMRGRYEYEVAGYNWRMTDVHAAIGLPQLRRLDEINAARRRNAARLDAGLDGVPGLVTPVVASPREHVFHQYTVRVTPGARCTRDEVVDRLTAAGIGAGVYYPRLVHDYGCYRAHPHVAVEPTPVAARIVTEVVSLPVHPGCSDADLDRVVDTVRSVLG